MNDHFFANTVKEHLDEKELVARLRKGVTNFNFFDEKEYAKAYTGTILDTVYKARANKIIPPPAIYIEEADLLCKDAEDYSCKMAIKCVKKGRKHGFNMKFITQRLSSIHHDISENFKYLLIGGNLTSKDLKRLGEITTSEIVSETKALRFQPDKGIRNFILIYPDRKTYKIIRQPHNCAVECYREEE